MKAASCRSLGGQMTGLDPVAIEQRTNAKVKKLLFVRKNEVRTAVPTSSKFVI